MVLSFYVFSYRQNKTGNVPTFFFSSFLTDPVFPYWQGITLLFYVLGFSPKRPNGSPLLDLRFCFSVVAGYYPAALMYFPLLR